MTAVIKKNLNLEDIDRTLLLVRILNKLGCIASDDEEWYDLFAQWQIIQYRSVEALND